MLRKKWIVIEGKKIVTDNFVMEKINYQSSNTDLSFKPGIHDNFVILR